MAKKKTQEEAPPAPKQLNFFQRLSVNRQLDILGYFIGIIGILSFVTLLPPQKGNFTGAWAQFLQNTFGWGAWLFPLGLLVLGIWLVARNLDTIPQLSAERGAGLFLIFLWLLSLLQAFDPQGLLRLDFSEIKSGGGYVGSLFFNLLYIKLGRLGAATVLLAWLLIALRLFLDMSIAELIAYISPPFLLIYETLRNYITEWLEAHSPKKEMPAVQMQGYAPTSETQKNPAAPQVEIGVSNAEKIEWILPPIPEILDLGDAPSLDEEFVENRARMIEETLDSFGAPVDVVEINRGPTITQFGVEPGFIQTRKGQTRVRVSKIASLSDDLALALSASRIRIQAPVPGKGYIGIEVPNGEMTMVALRDILESDLFQQRKTPLAFALGRDVAGYPKIADLTTMPHLLIAGTTGAGKSVCVNAILTSMLLHNTPDELRLVLVDPKRVELTGYNGIPHLLAPVVVETERVVGALEWMTREMDKRYHAFSQVGARNIESYNALMEKQGSKKLPYLVIVIDELADLMMIAPDDTERTITRLAQLARATGIHMILATQRPSTDVVTGLIKANFPARIAFAVASGTDSRVILDQSGAERLLGRGDMLYQAPDAPSAIRLQGVFISDLETERLVEFWRLQTAGYISPHLSAEAGVASALPRGVPLKQVEMFEDEMNEAKKIDPLYDEAVDLVRRQGRASVSMLQRRLRIGYTRASRLVDEMEAQGIVSEPMGGTGVRDVLDYGAAAPPVE